MTSIKDILNFRELENQVVLGNVRVQSHPEYPDLKIANYTEKAAYSREWNDITRICRGLIWDSDTLEVLARPFPKFFNLGEPEAPGVKPDERITYHNKYDGSLGILYVRPDGVPAIATRGSFDSMQARLGTKLLHGSGLAYQHAEYVDSGLTPLYEICGPENRIVLKYEENFLARLGFVRISDGAYIPISAPEIAASTTLTNLLARPDRDNAEGWVIWLDPHRAVKLKYEKYVELHRVVTNLSEKEVWRQLRAGTYNTFKLALPDEWWGWADGVADGLRAEFAQKHNDATQVKHAIEHQSPRLESRKDQALWVNAKVKPEYRGLIFSLLDGRDISDAIWRMLEPKGATL